jgi:hypothetical protein
MTPEKYVQCFTDTDSGEVERITTEPLEYWTADGWEIIPSGFRIQSVPFFRLDSEEIRICLLHQWRRTAKNTPRVPAVMALRRDLINYTRERYKGITGRFWAFLRDRIKIELLSITYMFQCRTNLILKNVLQRYFKRYYNVLHEKIKKFYIF